jgi:hypothetical protein
MERLLDLGNGMSIAKAAIGELKEQDLNARVMDHGMFAQLVANVRKRNSFESLPYCAFPAGAEEIEIISGHHRVQAYAAAGYKEVVFLLDESGLTRSQITAKQLAHNAIAGYDDQQVLQRLLDSISDVDDLLEMPKLEPIAFPDVSIEYRTLSFAFLPHQLENFELLLDSLTGRQEMIAVAPMELYDAFVKAVSRFSRVKRIGRAATAVALLTEIALQEAQRAEDEEAAAEADDAAGE